jgi:hypothetical protein
MANKPEDMSDEMWAAVQIVLEDQQIKSYRELTEGQQRVIERMDQMEDKWAETQAHSNTPAQENSGTAAQGGSENGEQGGGESGNQGQSERGSQGTGGPVSGGEGSPPPVVESEDGDRPRGSGRGGRPRWYEREGYAK